VNWFERYGIPGAYFIGLMVGWGYAFCPNLFTKSDNGWEWLFAIAAIVFLPVGYIISIFGQAVYLKWRCCFARCPKLRVLLGFHGAAMDRLSIVPPIPDEAIIEARTLLLSVSRRDLLDVNTHEYMRNWIARRMDVVAIDQSIFWASVLAGFIASLLCLLRPGEPSPAPTIILSIISFLAILVTICSFIVLRRQVIAVIEGIYVTYWLAAISKW